VIPKQELEWMDDYDDETVAHCMVITKKLMKHMKKTMSDIHFVYLAVEGLEVPHRHTHLIPYPETIVDKPRFGHVQYDDEEKQQYLELLQTNLSD
jgi:diadenosine tetraphosphate (Ap4A) HIT family hydrolase